MHSSQTLLRETQHLPLLSIGQVYPYYRGPFSAIFQLEVDDGGGCGDELNLETATWLETQVNNIALAILASWLLFCESSSRVLMCGGTWGSRFKYALSRDDVLVLGCGGIEKYLSEFTPFHL